MGASLLALAKSIYYGEYRYPIFEQLGPCQDNYYFRNSGPF